MKKFILPLIILILIAALLSGCSGSELTGETLKSKDTRADWKYSGGHYEDPTVSTFDVSDPRGWTIKTYPDNQEGLILFLQDIFQFDISQYAESINGFIPGYIFNPKKVKYVTHYAGYVDGDPEEDEDDNEAHYYYSYTPTYTKNPIATIVIRSGCEDAALEEFKKSCWYFEKEGIILYNFSNIDPTIIERINNAISENKVTYVQYNFSGPNCETDSYRLYLVNDNDILTIYMF